MKWFFKRDILENESRAAIYRYIKENPGTYPQEIMRETSMNRGTVFYHLDVLLYAGMVARLKEGKLRRYRASMKEVV